MSGKDFYEDDSGDASKYYRPDAPATASFFAAPAAAGGGEGAAGSQESIFKDHVSAFGAPQPRASYGTAPPLGGSQAQVSPVMTGSIDPMPASEQVQDVGLRDDGDDLPRERPPSQPAQLEEAPAPGNYSWWQPEYYRYLFNVDTIEVLNRLRKSLIPWPPNFIHIARENPDLYGPFWITSTVVFLMAAVGNLNSFIAHYESKNSNPWHYEIDYVSFSAFAIYGYNFILPLILWGACKCLDINLRLMDCICIYGYALFVYVPVTLLALIPIDWVRWLLVGVAALISSLFLAGNFWMELKTHVKYGLLITGIVVLLNIGLALTFKLYFFHLVDIAKGTPAPSTTPPVTTPPATTHNATLAHSS